MNANDELKAGEKSILEAWFEAELPQIVLASDDDLEAALAALDRYLDQAPVPKLQKALLAWKGLFYLEHGRHDDAVRELRTADGLQIPDDGWNFTTKLDLAKALEEGGDLRGAYAVLTAALNEIEEAPFLLDLLPALVRVTAITGQAMPPRAEAALSRAKQFYGLDHLPEGDLPAEAVRVAELVDDASAGFNKLHGDVEQAESSADKISLVEEYRDDVTVPYFKQRAEDLLHRVREGTAYLSSTTQEK